MTLFCLPVNREKAKKGSPIAGRVLARVMVRIKIVDPKTPKSPPKTSRIPAPTPTPPPGPAHVQISLTPASPSPVAISVGPSCCLSSDCHATHIVCTNPPGVGQPDPRHLHPRLRHLRLSVDAAERQPGLPQPGLSAPPAAVPHQPP